MNKNTTSVIPDKNEEPYDPNDPDSVAIFWEGARIEHKGKVIGTAHRPEQNDFQKKVTKVQVTLKLSPDILNYFKDMGEGWQTRMDEALREYVQTHH